MFWICTFIAFIAGKDIEVCTVKPDSIFLQLREISFHIKRRLRCTKIALRAACPVTVPRHGSIHKTARIIFIVAWRCMVIVAVLIVNAKLIAKIMHRIHKRFHAFPAAGLFTCRGIVRMLIVITRLSPAVQMKIHLFHTKIMNRFHFLLAHRKRHDTVVFFRILRIEKAGLRLHKRLDSCMYKTRSRKVANGWVLYRLFF